MKYLTIILAVIISGCALHSEPYINYKNKNHPLSDTSVFAVESTDSRLLVSIHTVDGEKYSPKGAGSSFWVRVLPGKHTFGLMYQLMDNGTYSYKYTDVEVSVDMKPRNVYLALPQVAEDDSGLTVDVKNIPEGEVYTMGLGLQGVNYQEFPAKF